LPRHGNVLGHNRALHETDDKHRCPPRGLGCGGASSAGQALDRKGRGIMRSEEFLEREGQSETITVIFKNAPSKQAPKLLLEHFGQLDESKTKEWGKGYKYKLDRRPNYMGGDQLHIWGPKGRAWAYRYNGVRSEANKYTSAATNIVKDIVSGVFGIDKLNIEEALILHTDNQAMLIEIVFA